MTTIRIGGYGIGNDPGTLRIRKNDEGSVCDITGPGSKSTGFNINEDQARQITQALLAVFPGLSNLYFAVPQFKAVPQVTTLQRMTEVRTVDTVKIAETVEVLHNARAAAIEGDAPSRSLRQLDELIDGLVALIHDSTVPPQFYVAKTALPMPPGGGWVPQAQVVSDPHWPMCFEKRGGWARRAGDGDSKGYCVRGEGN